MSGSGEFELIASLASRLDPAADGLGIGDDAAAWMPAPGALVVATTDMLVEGVHFRLDWTSARDLGWKALAVNLSDLAAMGATPGRALVSVALLPAQTALVGEMYEGLSELARLTGTQVVGGDTVRTSGPLVVNVALIGEAEPGRLFAARRGAARRLGGPDRRGRRIGGGPGAASRRRLRPTLRATGRASAGGPFPSQSAARGRPVSRCHGVALRHRHQ